MPPPPPNSLLAPVASQGCRVQFAAATTAIVEEPSAAPALAIALPVLSGGATEHLLEPSRRAERRDGCHVFATEGQLAGFILARPDLDLESATLDAYRRVFAAAAGQQLYRIWNYVPRINAVEDGLENYRRFCRARSVAFEEHFGAGYQRHLPAGSAVGTTTAPLAVAFAAGAAKPRHFENPLQVPAFEYPLAYGPRPPSFSRATLAVASNRTRVFLSGTAAIRGHATIGAGDLAAQLACTRENLRLIAAAAGAGDDFGSAHGWRRALKVYVRHAADFPAVQRDLERHLLRAADDVTYLQAELCRSELLVEIEAVLTRDF